MGGNKKKYLSDTSSPLFIYLFIYTFDIKQYLREEK